MLGARPRGRRPSGGRHHQPGCHGRDGTIELVRRLHGLLRAPLTVDLEDGYDDDPSSVADLVRSLAGSGVVGVNLEDAGRTAAAQSGILAAVRSANPHVFLNARVDELWSGGRDLGVALERGRAYRDAGAHGLFLPGLADRRGVEAVADLGLPLNPLW